MVSVDIEAYSCAPAIYNFMGLDLPTLFSVVFEFHFGVVLGLGQAEEIK